MTEYHRVKDPVSGAEYTYDDAKIEALGLSEHVIDKKPLGPDGLPAPSKPRLPLGEPLPGSSADRRRATGKGNQTQGYAAMKAADLKAEIEKRNADREDDDQLSTRGNKAALVAVLEAADEAADNPADDEPAVAPSAPETPDAARVGEDAGQSPSAAPEKEN